MGVMPKVNPFKCLHALSCEPWGDYNLFCILPQGKGSIKNLQRIYLSTAQENSECEECTMRIEDLEDFMNHTEKIQQT